MPRLTNSHFLLRHHFLAALWSDEEFRALFSILDPNEQWDVHQYYQTLNTDSEKEVIETRTTVNAGDRSLTQRAGRAYAKLERRYLEIAGMVGVLEVDNLAKSVPRVSRAHARAYSKHMKGIKPRLAIRGRSTVSVAAIVKPQIDLKQLADVLVRLTLERRNAAAKDVDCDNSR